MLFSVVNHKPTRSRFYPRRFNWRDGENFPSSRPLSYELAGWRAAASGQVMGGWCSGFARPNFKQSNETLFLQIAESGAVDSRHSRQLDSVSAVRRR